MSGDMTAEEIRHHVRRYIAVFLGLLFLTVVTVAVSYLHLAIHLAVFVAMLVATIKASLVAAVFMHLMGEKKIIYWALILTIILFVPLISLPVMSDFEVVTYLRNLLAHVS